MSRNPRYTNQLVKMDCFPAAFANLLKWSGRKYSYKENRHILYEKFKLNYYYGTLRDVSEKVMKKPIKGIKLKYQKRITYKKIIDHLNRKGCVLLTYKKDHGRFHAALIIKENANSISVVNHSTKTLISNISKNKFKQYIRRYNTAYFASKKS